MTSDVNKYDDYSDQFILVPVQENMVGVEENFQLFEIDPGGQDVVDVDPDNDIAIRDRELIGTEIRGTNPDSGQDDTFVGSDIYREKYKIELEDGTRVIIEGITIFLEDSTGKEWLAFTPTGGFVFPSGKVKFLENLESINTVGDVTFLELDAPCFVSGTQIQTSDGLRAVEDLRQGDIVTGYEGKDLILRKALSSRLSERALRANPNLRPVRILAGALGNDLPARDLLVSRQHRMLVSSKISERMFGQNEVLIPAIRLTELPGVFIDEDVNDVEYFHLLFDEHEVIFAEGAPTESLLTGPEALKSLSPEAREEILAIFPQVANMNFTPKPARLVPTGRKQKQLITWHIRTSQPLG